MGRRLLGVTDRQGTDTLGAGRIAVAMKKAGVKEADEMRKVRSLGLERVRLPESPESESDRLDWLKATAVFMRCIAAE